MKFKPFIFVFFTCCFLAVDAQQECIADKIEVISTMRGYSTYTFTNKYNTCTTWYQSSEKKEYLIYNMFDKIYFADISDPAFPVKLDSLETGWVSHKHIFTYKNYCYATDGINDIIMCDLSTLPDSITFVKSDFSRNYYNSLFINDKMFSVMSGTNILVTDFSDPFNIAIIDSVSKDIPEITTINSLSKNNDTLYASCGTHGLFILRYDPALNKFFLMDSVPNSSNQNSYYNHFVLNNILIKTQYPYSTEDDIYLNNNGVYSFNNNALFLPGDMKKYFCDLNNKWVISYNNVGLFLYNIDNILNPVKLGSFSTYNSSSGISNAVINCMGNHNGKYVIALNNVNGIYILDPAEAIKTTEKEPLLDYNLLTFPNPANTGFTVQLKRDYPATLTLNSLNGISLYKRIYNGNINDFISTLNIPEGNYILKIEGNEGQLTSKIIIKH